MQYVPQADNKFRGVDCSVREKWTASEYAPPTGGLCLMQDAAADVRIEVIRNWTKRGEGGPGGEE